MTWYIITGGNIHNPEPPSFGTKEAALAQLRLTVTRAEDLGRRVVIDREGRVSLYDGATLVDTLWVETEDRHIVRFTR